MRGPELLERITARRAEPDEREEQPAKQPAEVRAERDELAVAERVLERVSEQLAAERVSVAPVNGRAVMLIPHRTSGVEKATLPPDCRRIFAAARQAAGPIEIRQAGDALGIDVSTRATLEPLRGKPVRLVDRGDRPGRAAPRSAPGRHGRRKQRVRVHRPPLARRADHPARSPGAAPGPRPEEGRQAGRGGGLERRHPHRHPAPHRRGRPAKPLRQTPPSRSALPRPGRREGSADPGIRRPARPGRADYGYCAGRSRFLRGLRPHLVHTLQDPPVALAPTGTEAGHRARAPAAATAGTRRGTARSARSPPPGCPRGAGSGCGSGRGRAS
ncbi:hypothetical protein SUDANB6_01018 [Streptomyces sp. enrichment culture]